MTLWAMAAPPTKTIGAFAWPGSNHFHENGATVVSLRSAGPTDTSSARERRLALLPASLNPSRFSTRSVAPDGERISGRISPVEVRRFKKNLERTHMKALLKAFVVALISFSFLSTGFAGDKMKDCVHMKDGKMMMMKDGKEMAMEKDMTMTDGSKVTKDGTHVTKDGKSMKLKDGDMVMMDGTMTSRGEKKPEKK